MKAGALKLIVSAAFSPWNKPTPVRQMTEVKHSSTHGPRNFFMPMIPPALKFRCRAMLSEHARHSHHRYCKLSLSASTGHSYGPRLLLM